MTAQETAAAPEIDGYQHLRPLGAGGFADVFLYEHAETGAHVAVKVLRGDTVDEAVRQQFVTEAQAMGRLTRAGRHPYIVAVDTIARIGNRPYLIMEYCPGGSLADRLAGQRWLDVSEVLEIGVRIAGALQTAHLAGIVHRDIKPGNILIGGDNEPKLADFGIAALTVDDIARGADGLSVHYAAPEVLDGPGDERSDVYALAATLYELLAGRPPFKVVGRDNRYATVERRIRTEDVPPPGRDDVPEPVLVLLRAALTKDPELRARRVPSAKHFAQGLRDIQHQIGYPPTELKVYTPARSQGRDVSHLQHATPLPPAWPPWTVQAAEQVARVEPEPPRMTWPQPSDSGDGPHQGGAWRRETAPEPTTQREAAPTDTATADGDGSGDAPGAAERPQREWLWFAVAGTVVVSLVAAAVAWTTSGDGRRPSSQTGVGMRHSESAPDADALVDPDGVIPVPTVEAQPGADGSVTFVWRYDGAADGDFFQVRRVDVSGTQTTQVVVPQWSVRPEAGGRPCIEVTVVRRSGRMSQPGRACAP